MTTGGNIRAGRAFVELYGDSTKLMAAIKHVEEKFKAFGNAVAGWGKKFSAIGGMITAPMLAAAHSYAEAGSKIFELSKRTGMSAEALSRMSYVFQAAGSDVDSFAGAMSKMAKNLSGIDEESQGVQRALHAMGVDVTALRNMTPEEQFKVLAEGISKLPTPMDRAAAAMKIFGRAGAELLPVIDGGREGIEAMQARAEELGLVMSGKTAADAKKLSLAFMDLELVIKSAWKAVGAAIAPVVMTVSKAITDAVITLKKFINDNKDMVVKIFLVGSAILAAGAALLLFGKAIVFSVSVFQALQAVAAATWSVITATWGLIMVVVGSPILMVIALLASLAVAFFFYSGQASKALEWLSGRMHALVGFASEAFQGIADALVAGDIMLAAQILWKSLQVAWYTGVGYLETIWLKFKLGFLTVFWGAVYGAMAAWSILQNALVTSWVETVAFLKRVWVEFAAWYQNLILKLGSGLSNLKIRREVEDEVGEEYGKGPLNKHQKDMLKFQYGMDFAEGTTLTPAQIQSIVDAEVAKRIAHKDKSVAGDAAAIENQKKQDLAAIEKDRSYQRKSQETDFAGDMAKIGQDYQDKIDAAKKSMDEKIAAGNSDLAKLWEEFHTLVAKAKKERENKEASLKAEAPPKVEGMQAGVTGAIKEIGGTFNPFAATAMGGTIVNRIALATETTAKNTAEIVAAVKAANSGIYSQ